MRQTLEWMLHGHVQQQQQVHAQQFYDAFANELFRSLKEPCGDLT